MVTRPNICYKNNSLPLEHIYFCLERTGEVIFLEEHILIRPASWASMLLTIENKGIGGG